MKNVDQKWFHLLGLIICYLGNALNVKVINNEIQKNTAENRQDVRRI